MEILQKWLEGKGSANTVLVQVASNLHKKPPKT